jgi:copper chaperone CopZ
MEQLILTLPTMWADHHVINVKRILSPIAGVENVYASSAFKQVLIEFDPAKTSQAALVKALTDAGYAPGEEEVVAESPYAQPDPAWDRLAQRITMTNPVDLQMSGEFRKY